MAVAYLKYTKFYPAPVVLVFEVNGELSVQVADANDLVSSYDPVPSSHYARLAKFDRPDISTSVGDQVIHAFEVSPGKLLLGAREELLLQYESLAARTDINEYPFLIFEIAQSINHLELEEKSAILCAQAMSNLSISIATNWLCSTPMSAEANRVAKKSLESKIRGTFDNPDDHLATMLNIVFRRVVESYQKNKPNDILSDIEKLVAPIVESAEILAIVECDIDYKYDSGYATFAGIQLPDLEVDYPHISIIESNTSSVIINLCLRIQCDVIGEFSFFTLDSIDREHIDLGSVEHHRMHEFEADVLVTLSGDFVNDIQEVSVQEVEFHCPTIPVDFGYVTFR